MSAQAILKLNRRADCAALGPSFLNGTAIIPHTYHMVTALYMPHQSQNTMHLARAKPGVAPGINRETRRKAVGTSLYLKSSCVPTGVGKR
jgi:hypothetical protein